MEITDILNILPIATILGIIWKFYTFAQSSAKKEEIFKNRLSNLEKDSLRTNNELITIRDKMDTETKQILEKLDSQSEKQDRKMEELKNLILEIFRDK